MSSPREQLYFGMEWNVDHGKITLRVHGGGADVSAEYHFDWLAGEFMACRIITQGEETHT